jgi:hypothetical protein
MPGAEYPVYDGEKIRMDVYYHWGPLWLRAARVEVSARVSSANGKKTWELLATGHTLPSYDWFFKVRDTFSVSVLQDGFVPLKALRKTSEGGFMSYGHYQFDAEKDQVFITSYTSKRPFEKKHFSVKGCTYDLLSGAYFARTWITKTESPAKKSPSGWRSTIRYMIYTLRLKAAIGLPYEMVPNEKPGVLLHPPSKGQFLRETRSLPYGLLTMAQMFPSRLRQRSWWVQFRHLLFPSMIVRSIGGQFDKH